MSGGLASDSKLHFETRTDLVEWARQRVNGMNASSAQERMDVLADIRRVTDANPHLFKDQSQ